MADPAAIRERAGPAGRVGASAAGLGASPVPAPRLPGKPSPNSSKKRKKRR